MSVFFQGAENCLEGCVFVLTGVMESMERDDAKALIERYGGKVTGNVSKKTTYLVQGRDGGVSKLEKVIYLPSLKKKDVSLDTLYVQISFTLCCLTLLRLKALVPRSWMKMVYWS